MKYRQRIYNTETQKALMWDRWQRGESLDLTPINSAMRCVRISIKLFIGRITYETQDIYRRANYWNFEAA